MKNLFKNENDTIALEVTYKKFATGKYAYVWTDERTNKEVFQSETIETYSKHVVCFIGLMECIKYLDQFDSTKFIKCDNQLCLTYFLSRKLSSTSKKIQSRIEECYKWMDENEETIKRIKTPWKNIMWRIPASTVIEDSLEEEDE